jgi:hypothetical protein
MPWIANFNLFRRLPFRTSYPSMVGNGAVAEEVGDALVFTAFEGVAEKALMEPSRSGHANRDLGGATLLLHTRLIGLNEVFNPARILLAMAMTGHGISAPGGLDQDLGPKQARVNMHGGHFGQADADFITAKPARFAPDDGIIGHFNDCGKKEIAASPSTGFKTFGCHKKIFSSRRVPHRRRLPTLRQLQDG